MDASTAARNVAHLSRTGNRSHLRCICRLRGCGGKRGRCHRPASQWEAKWHNFHLFGRVLYHFWTGVAWWVGLWLECHVVVFTFAFCALTLSFCSSPTQQQFMWKWPTAVEDIAWFVHALTAERRALHVSCKARVEVDRIWQTWIRQQIRLFVHSMRPYRKFHVSKTMRKESDWWMTKIGESNRNKCVLIS